MGLYRAGFDVIGCDVRKQPRYPFPFVQADALKPPFDLAAFDLVWASPPCQAFSLARNMKTTRPHPNHIPATRALLAAARCLTVIENVPRSPLRVDLKLDGWMFSELRVIRERWFELNFMVFGPEVTRPRNLLMNGYISVVGMGTPLYMVKRGIRYLVGDCRRALGIDWMSRQELSQSVPPAYAEFIGRAAVAYIARGRTV